MKNLFAAAVALAFLSPAALAHGPEMHGKAGAAKAISTEEHPWCRQGDPAKVTRTVAIGMSDAMRFTPA